MSGASKRTRSSLSGTSSLLIGAAVAAVLLSACNEKEQTNADGSLSSNYGNRQLSVSGTVRPRLDPAVLEKIKQEESEALERQRQAAIEAQKVAAAQQNGLNGYLDANNPDKSNLPPVDTSPISGIANALGFGNNNQNNAAPSSPVPNAPTAPPPQQPTMGYGGYQSGTSLIPPPPAVSVSATMAPPPADMGYPPPPYGYNPYGYPPPNYGGYPPQQPQQVAAAQPAHPSGSLFSNGGSGASSSSSDDDKPKKKDNMVLITPTGMESRSPFKQRDDLKVLIKGALANTSGLRDDKIAQSLARIDVGLPSESTKGNLSLTQRQIDNLFKTPQVDKKVLPLVKKVEADLAQAYYRYLYSYNKFSLTQQQIAARKQEVDVADTNAERQRAAADLSAAQADADGSKEDMRAAQVDLASIAGAQAARSIITRVSGQAPSLDSLASDDGGGGGKKDEGLMGSMASALNPMNVFNVFGHKGGNGKGGGSQVASNDSGSSSGADEVPPSPVETKPAKKSKKNEGKSVKMAQASVTPARDDSDSAPSPPVEKAPSPPPQVAGVSFELKNVQTTPRKSILKVAIKNNSDANVNIDTEAIHVVEGDRRLDDASVRAVFDTSLVQPNQEITGTITIYGRPWNDRLTVSISDGGKTIQLHR